MVVAAAIQSRPQSLSAYDCAITTRSSSAVATVACGLVVPQVNAVATFVQVYHAAPAATCLTKAMGFTPVGVYRNVGFKLGAGRDVGWWG
jgi:hypothetical protein